MQLVKIFGSNKLLLLITLVCFLIQITACGSKSENKVLEQMPEAIQNQFGSSVVVPISLDSCISISLMNDGERIILSEDDSNIVLAFLNSAMYNKERNDSGIKYKMVAPDYTFIAEFESENKLVMYWISESLLLYETEWYNILSQFAIEPVLEKY